MVTLLTPPMHFEIAADGANLSAVRDWSRQIFAARFPQAPEAEGHAFVLAVHEAVRNVIDHAYDGWGGVVRVEATPGERSLIVRLTHRGRSFDGAAPPPDFDGSRDRGLGLFLMECGLTRVRYRTLDDGCQQVELVKELEEEKQ